MNQPWVEQIAQLVAKNPDGPLSVVIGTVQLTDDTRSEVEEGVAGAERTTGGVWTRVELTVDEVLIGDPVGQEGDGWLFGGRARDGVVLQPADGVASLFDQGGRVLAAVVRADGWKPDVFQDGDRIIDTTAIVGDAVLMSAVGCWLPDPTSLTASGGAVDLHLDTVSTFDAWSMSLVPVQEARHARDAELGVLVPLPEFRASLDAADRPH
jgi:hypothetical protein